MVSVHTLSVLAACLFVAAASRDSNYVPVTFQHGVASGDPQGDSIVLWTRVTPSQPAQQVAVAWEVSKSSSFKRLAAKGQTKTTAGRDWTVKVDARGLEPHTTYHFRFIAGGAVSPIGKFRVQTAARRLDRLRYVLFSCSSWGWGYFNAYAAAARLLDLDFTIALGDWIYEYSAAESPAPHEAVRAAAGVLQPPWETVSLADYRARHAFYRRDADVQALSAAAAMIAMWDDHEFADNAYVGGAANHNSTTEGSWEARKRAALQAYHEWMPTRVFGDEKHAPGLNPAFYRTFQFGDLATLFMTETRITARSKPGPTEQEVVFDVGSMGFAVLPPIAWPAFPLLQQALDAYKAASDAERQRLDRAMLGPAQLDWIRSSTRTSVARDTKWQLYAAGTVLQDQWMGDLEGAVERQADPAKKALWQSELQNLTGTDPTATTSIYTKLAFLAPLKGAVIPVSVEMRQFVRSVIAIARNQLNFVWDSWMGYQQERARYLQAITQGAAEAGATCARLNALFYGGDSHNAWAGLNRLDNGEVVGPEFDAPSVTSPGYELVIGFAPTEMVADAFLAANPNLAYANTDDRGFMLVTLDKTRHRLEMQYVNTVASADHTVFCGAAFEVRAGDKTIRRVPCA